MSLLKKIFFGVFVVLSVSLAIWGYNYLKQNKKPSTDVLALLPDSCSYYFSTKNFSELSVKLNSQSLIFNSWSSFNELQELKRNFRFYDSLIYANEQIVELIKGNTIHFSVYQSDNSFSFITGFNLKELKQEDEVKEFCKAHFKEQGSGFYEIKSNLFAGVEQGVLLISNSVKWLNRSFEKGNKLKGNKLFLEQIDQVGQTDQIKVYVNHQLAKAPVLNVNTLLPAVESVSGIKFNPNEIIVNGNYKPNNTLTQRFIQTQEAANLQLTDKIPFNASSIEAYAVTSGKELKKLISANELHIKFWNEINEKALYNASNEFYDLFQQSIFSFQSFNRSFAGICVSDTTDCNSIVNYFGDQDTIFQNCRIKAVKAENITRSVFGELFNLNATHVFVYNDVLYFSEGLTAAKELIYALSNNSTLQNNSTFVNYASENLNTQCNYVYYLVPNENKVSIKRVTNLNFESNKDVLTNLTEANLVVSKQKSAFKFRMQLNYRSPSSSDIPNLLWQCNLDSNLITAPGIFVNHITKENELVVQDKLDQLYLINSTGTVLWKKKINESIRSKVYTVDIFKNKKHQLLFNTDNYIHLIDRNGNYVQGYPLKLPSKASNALSLIDYDNDGDSRIFIACSNKLIYNYTLYGVRSEGYKPYRTEAEVKLPVKFVRVGESDYLITIDETGTIHAFSRKGDGRIGFKNKAVEQCSDFTLVATNNINRTFLYYIDVKNNLINRISFADKKDVIKLNNDITNAAIIFSELNNDQTPDFVAQSASGVHVYDINGVVLYENAKIENEERTLPQILNGKIVYYNYESANSKINLVSNENTDLNSIKANSAPLVYNLFNDSKHYIIYSVNSKLTCNLLK